MNKGLILFVFAFFSFYAGCSGGQALQDEKRIQVDSGDIADDKPASLGETSSKHEASDLSEDEAPASIRGLSRPSSRKSFPEKAASDQEERLPPRISKKAAIDQEEKLPPHIPGQAIIILEGDNNPPLIVGSWKCTVKSEAGGGIFSLECRDDHGEFAPVRELCIKLEALPEVKSAEPNWIRRMR